MGIQSRISHYEILSAIGKGGMGEVWKARDTNLDREVAIKTLPPEFAANAEHLARFRREAQAASALNHPNICVVHDLGEHQGQLFIVMELLRGETLREHLERGPLPIEEALDLSMQIADGLDAAHSAGILHRDIKPANIFITDRGTAKLLDFGLARAQSTASDAAPTIDVTAAGTVMGTVSYMSPEQGLERKNIQRTPPPTPWPFICEAGNCPMDVGYRWRNGRPWSAANSPTRPQPFARFSSTRRKPGPPNSGGPFRQAVSG